MENVMVDENVMEENVRVVMEDLKKEMKAEMKAEIGKLITEAMEEFRGYFKSQTVFQSLVMKKFVNLEEKVEALKVKEVKVEEMIVEDMKVDGVDNVDGEVKNENVEYVDNDKNSLEVEDVVVNIAKAVEKEVVMGEKDEDVAVKNDKAVEKEEKEKEKEKEKEEKEKEEKEEKEKEEKKKEKEEKEKKENKEKEKKEKGDEKVKVKKVVLTHKGKTALVKDETVVEDKEEKKAENVVITRGKTEKERKRKTDSQDVQFKDPPPQGVGKDPPPQGVVKRARRQNPKIVQVFSNLSDEVKT